MNPALRARLGFYILGTVFLVAASLRIAHVLSQPVSDPSFAHPALDSAYYLDWARAIASGSPGPPGAFYLAPAYPYLLALWFALAGDRLVGMLLLQQGAMLASAWLLGSIARRAAGVVAGIVAATLFLFYQPSMFFASRPLSETLALLCLCAALRIVASSANAGALAAGALSGLAGLTKPNLLLVPLAWIAMEACARRWKRATSIALATAVVIAPVTLRNLVISGHPVLVSSNGGITLFHGNGPGSLGIFNPPDGFSGALPSQREEATEIASLRSGKQLDAVEADHWWGREAIRARMADPASSVALVLTKLLLTVDNYEHGLDDPPMLDVNPWACLWSVPGTARAGDIPRRVSWIPFALILGLAMAALAVRGARESGGWPVWGAILASAATPIVFYVSSRYRLPVACLLVIPAGVGATALGGWTGADTGRKRTGWIVLAACMAASFCVPFQSLRAAEVAGALANRAGTYRQAGNPAEAEKVARQAISIDPESTGARFVLGVVLEHSGRDAEAEAEYRGVVARDPGHAEAAGNLAGLLTRTGRPAEGVPIVRAALAARPGHRACTINLVVALFASGDVAGARRELAAAEGRGMSFDPELVQVVNGS